MLTRDREAVLVARIKAGGRKGIIASSELCVSMRPYVMHLAHRVSTQYPALDTDDVIQSLWMRVLMLARTHDTSRSRLLHMVRLYAVPKVIRDLTHQCQRQPSVKTKISTWRYDACEVRDGDAVADPRDAIDTIIDTAIDQ